jgi:hypothetical protein
MPVVVRWRLGSPRAVSARTADSSATSLVAGGGAGDAEVEDAGAEDAGLAGDEDVVGFEVAVDEAGAVGGGEALAGLAVDGDDGGPVAGVVAGPGGEGGSGDVLHREEDAALPDGDVVDGDDVGVGEAGDRAGLAEQAGAGLVGAAAAQRAQELDGDAAVELGVVAEVDLAHAADAEQLEHDEATDLVAAAELVGGGLGGAGGSSCSSSPRVWPRSPGRVTRIGRRGLAGERLGVLEAESWGRGVGRRCMLTTRRDDSEDGAPWPVTPGSPARVAAGRPPLMRSDAC